MNRYVASAAGSLALWGLWLLCSMFGATPEFDGLAFLFAAIASSQLIMLGARDRGSDALKTLLALQAVFNLSYLICVVLDLRLEVARNIMLYATLAQLTIAYTVAFKRRRIPV